MMIWLIAAITLIFLNRLIIIVFFFRTW